VNNSEAYKKLKCAIIDRWPDVKIKHKQDYDFWKLLPIERQYSSSAICNTIWMGAESFMTLAHEAKHQERIQKHGLIKFYFKYAFPQIIGALIILACIPLFFFSWIPALLLSIFSLLFFIPWPATFRAQLELEAYTLGMAIEMWTTGKISDYTKLNIFEAMTGRFYYKMVWDEDEALELIEAQERKLKIAPQTYIDQSYLHQIVYKICQEQK
jgi:hypothetical protein